MIDKPLVNESSMAKLAASRGRLALRERSANASNIPQWLYWAINSNHVYQFDNLLKILELAKSRKLTGNELGVIKDALAIGVTNVTPDRVDWTFRISGKTARAKAQSLFDPNNIIDSVELAVLAATPFDPSTEQYYNRLWTHFEGSLVHDKSAYTWY